MIEYSELSGEELTAQVTIDALAKQIAEGARFRIDIAAYLFDAIRHGLVANVEYTPNQYRDITND